MGRRTIPFTEDSVSRAIRAVKRAGVEVKTVRIEPNGAVVINADIGGLQDEHGYTEQELADSAAGYF
jgi:hypothetical protein